MKIKYDRAREDRIAIQECVFVVGFILSLGLDAHWFCSGLLFLINAMFWVRGFIIEFEPPPERSEER